MSESYIVYILECADHSLYTGITNNLEKRLKAHAAGKGAKYTRGRAPYVVRYTEVVEGRSLAQQRERSIKALSRTEKLQLIKEAEGSYVSPKKL